MKTTLTISALLFFCVTNAQNLLHSITTKTDAIDLRYDSVITITGTRYDTTRVKTTIKFTNTSTSKTDVSYSQSPVTKTDTMQVIKTVPKTVKIIMTLAVGTMFTVQVGAQTFSASVYGFGWYNEANTPPPVSEVTYGALWATWSGSQAIQATNTFSPMFTEIRASVIFSTWNGINSPITEQYLTSGKKVILNVHPFPQGADVSFADVDLAAWEANCIILVNSISDPSRVVLSCFNEEGNRNYSIINTPSDMEKYVKCLSILARVAATRGIKVSNGGITTNALVFTTYRYLSDIHSADTTNFMNYCVPRNWWTGLRNRNNSNVEDIIDNTHYLLNNYDTIPAEYLTNIAAHEYFPYAVRMTDTATNWIESYTGITQVTAMLNHFVPGREIITNECGFVISSTPLVAHVVMDFKSNNYKHVVYWNSPSGEDEVFPIATTPTTPTDIGNFYKEQIE